MSHESDALHWQPPWWLARPSSDLRFLVFCRVFALGTAMRLILPDAMQEDWLWVSVAHWLGAVLVAYNGCFIGWLTCAVASSLALLTLEDQLTKSIFMLSCALAALACFATKQRIERALPYAVRWVTLLVYALAGLHKLNRDFFNPAVSCANGGLELMLAHFPSLQRIAGAPFWPIFQVATEIGIVILFVARPAWAVLLATAMHLPLTIIFAPAFVFVMMSGWICFYTNDELLALGRTLRTHGIWIVLLGGALGAASRALFFPERWSTDPDWCVEEILLWIVLVWLVTAMLVHRKTAFRGRLAWTEPAPARFIALVIGSSLVINGLTPYFGIQFHHAAAMLSNLRIDDGCHNSFVFPASMRLSDPYVRIDRIGFAEGRAAPGVAEGITQRLWGPEALWQARTEWCAIHREPLPVSGTWQGHPFSTENFCAPDGWPFAPIRLPGWRRFQVNLTRTCPQRCVH